MTLVADLHIHSRFSRACSKSLTMPNLWAWAQIKGIDLLTVADFTHPFWFKEICEQLEEIDSGVFCLKESFKKNTDITIPKSCEKEMRFFLSTEISLIYKKGEKVRKIHHIIMSPNLDIAAKINVALEKRGNIRSDGRPILGLDSKELLKMLLDISPDIQLIPAHVWTPHFAIFGSKTGFDSVEECFEELSDHICALETGLSSDPAMNYRISKNDKYVFVSNSDAHSLQKLGREATLFDTEATYPSILNALRKDHQKVKGTIEFFPEEGKYHADGLRDEQLCLNPKETKELNFISPYSGKKITVGVLHRVDDLADRKQEKKSMSLKPYWSIIPLQEIIGEILGVGVNSKKAQAKYFDLIEKIGSEFYILKDAAISEINKFDEIMGLAIKRMREGNTIIKPGYDGEFGVIKLFSEEEIGERNQMKLKL